MSEEEIRVFIAIELSEETMSHLARLQDHLRAALPRGVRWVRPGGIHLTLKFLGNVPSSLVPRIQVALSERCQSVGPLALRLSGLGVFPNKNRARVIWVGLGGETEKLARLQTRVDGALEALGFGREVRTFSPHLTLGRVEERIPADARRQIGELVDAVAVSAPDSFEAKSISIMQSKLMRGGAIYGRLASIGL